MPRYRIATLIDITRTNAVRTRSDQLQISQQDNFNSLRQAIELRSNVTWTKDPEKKTGQLPMGLKGKATYWYWEFEVEREDLFLKDNDPVALLKDDLDSVPVITGLLESVEIVPAAVQINGPAANTWVEII
jgi:hypothetical protein